MTIFKKLDNWLIKMLWHKSDTPEELEQKVYLVRNGIMASIILSSIVCVPMMIYQKFHILFLAGLMVLAIIITDGLLMIIKRGIKWFLYFYYGGYIILCTCIIMILGGLPNSVGVWGGSFIVFMHSLAVKDKRIVIVNAIIYLGGLVAIALFYPILVPINEWTPEFNNLFFTINEIWMCLFLVKSFYDSIILRTNEEKRKAEHLQKIDILKSKLYANITHEFRTPLTLIKGNAGEILEHHDGEISEKAKSIIQSSDKILFLVNQMLNLSKIEEGHVPMHYYQYDIVAFLRFVTGSFQGLADFRKIRLLYEPQCAQLIMDIETEKLEETLSNLLSNAIKYTPEGGNVFVTVRKINPVESTKPKVEITVRDTGVGISEDKLDKIFIRFYRVEDKRFPYQEGTGIGLTLVNEYLKMMEGEIKVTSKPGKGSEFVITLPITNNAQIEETVPSQLKFMPKEETGIFKLDTTGSISNQNHQLLIIEDNAELREFLSRLLENEYKVITAVNGTKGIELAKEHIPDLILSDVMMPGKDGYQVCNLLKNDFRTSHIPIVLLTARADTDSRITGMEHGADAYITKPFNKKELIICLHNLLLQRETLRIKFSAAIFKNTIDGNDAGLNGKFMEKVIILLERNYKNDWYGIQHLYADLGISRAQLHRKLTALTGQSTSNFIRNFRLQKARTLLLETNKNVSDIAFEVGFGDSNYFSKSFLQEYGVNATEFRNSFSLSN